MAILVVGGGGKDVGKTALVCAIIRALREFEWTAVKITGHDYEPASREHSLSDREFFEETNAGEETDTARYLAAGARRALLVTRTGAEVPIEKIKNAIGSDRNIIFESNRIADVLRPDVCLALIGGQDRKSSFERLLRVADAAVVTHRADTSELPGDLTKFEIESADQLSVELLDWLRQKLATL
ncbi:MAG: hypothetical protein JST28_21575 [Acidobacteria bacterium]|nr:hypothetical protein [Acidobacteriota bacterium]